MCVHSYTRMWEDVSVCVCEFVCVCVCVCASDGEEIHHVALNPVEAASNWICPLHTTTEKLEWRFIQ